MVRKKTVYGGKIVSLSLETAIFPDGSQSELEIVKHPGGAAVVAVDSEGRVCLLRQYRHVVGGWLWELPAGKLDNNEPPMNCARRELREEAGLLADRWRPMGSVISSPGVFTEVIHLFLAETLTATNVDREPHEFIEVHWRPLAEALTMARDDKIRDAKTVVGLFRARAMLDAK